MLAAQREVPFAAAATGRISLVVSAVFRDTGHLYDYLTTSLTKVPGLRSVEPRRSSAPSSGPARTPDGRHVRLVVTFPGSLPTAPHALRSARADQQPAADFTRLRSCVGLGGG
jgi:hypothetical protein